MPAQIKSAKSNASIAVIGIDIGKNVFHLVGLDRRGAIVLKTPDRRAGGISFSEPESATRPGRRDHGPYSTMSCRRLSMKPSTCERSSEGTANLSSVALRWFTNTPQSSQSMPIPR